MVVVGLGVVVVVVLPGFNVVVVVVFPGFSVVVVVVFPGFTVVVVAPGGRTVDVVTFTVVVLDVDVLVVVGRDVVVVAPWIVVVVTVGRGTVVVVVVAVPAREHFGRQVYNAVLQFVPSMKDWPVHVLAHEGSGEVAHAFLHVASADATDASHFALVPAQVDPQSVAAPGAKQLPTAALYGVTQSASVHAFRAVPAAFTQAVVTRSSVEPGGNVVLVVPAALARRAARRNASVRVVKPILRQSAIIILS